MGLITIQPNGPVRTSSWIGDSYLSGYRFWHPYSENVISYNWVYENEWMVPPWLYKPSEAGDSFRGEELPEEVYESGAPTTIQSEEPPSLPPNISKLISEATIEKFKSSNASSESFSLQINSIETVGEKHRDEWYSYAGIYLLYGTYVTVFIEIKTVTYPVRLSKLACKDRDNLLENSLILEDECGSPLPPYTPSLGKSGGGGRRNRRKIKKSLTNRNEKMCCSCEVIADLLDRQSEQIKMMFDSQNTEISDGLTEQTKYLREQMIALAPKGFDYKPILDGQQDVKHDVINALWNGVPFNLK